MLILNRIYCWVLFICGNIFCSGFVILLIVVLLFELEVIVKW